MNSLKERLIHARQESKLSQGGLAKIAGVSQSAIAALESGRNESSTSMAKIASALGVAALWLETGKGDIKPAKNNIKSNATVLGGIDTWDSSTPLRDDEVEVPFYKDICLSAGNGFADDIADYNNFKLRFSKSTLRRYGIEAENIVCVTADGDSMDPVFPDGATLGINTGSKNIKDGKIYAINHGGLLRTKVLQRMPDNHVRIKSFNSIDYPDEIVPLNEINVIGQIFWWSVMAD